jgi:GNAT superfamily N-acetyltransferase
MGDVAFGDSRLLQIRWSTPADLAPLTAVFVRASLSNEGDREALLANPAALVLEGDSIAKGRSRVATHTDHIVGFATIVLIDGVFDLQDLFVDPEWMRQGVGRQLVHDAAAIAARRGVECISVTANPHALDFYEALGFVVDGKVQTLFGPGQRMHLGVARGHS